MVSFNRYLFLACMLSIGLNSMGQADISMITSLYNRGNYNPAFIARTDYLYLFSDTRQQWIGFDGAPKVYYLQVSDYVHSLQSAFGLSLMNDQIGNSTALNPMASYAFRIQSKKGRVLSLGLSAGVFNRSIDGSEYDADNILDPTINYSVEESTNPDANVGLEYQTGTFILGLSSTHLFSMGKDKNYYHNTNHRYGYVIYKNNNDEHFYYKLGLQVINRNNMIIYEGSALLRLKHGTGLMNGPMEIFDFGVAYRTSRQLALIMGILVTPDLRLGYAYDQNFIQEYYQNTTHEIMLEYRIFNKAASTRLCGRK